MNKKKFLEAAIALTLMLPFGIASATIVSPVPMEESAGIERVEKAIADGKCTVTSYMTAAQCLNNNKSYGESAPTEYFETGDGWYSVYSKSPYQYIEAVDSWSKFSKKWMTTNEKKLYDAIKATKFDKDNINYEGSLNSWLNAYDSKYHDSSLSYSDYKVEEGISKGICKTTPKNLKEAITCINKVEEEAAKTSEYGTYINRDEKTFDTNPNMNTVDSAAYYAYNANELVNEYATQEEKNKIYTAIFKTKDSMAEALNYIAQMDGQTPTSLREAAGKIAEATEELGIEKAFVNAANGDPEAMTYLIQKYPDFAKAYVTMHEYATIASYQANGQFNQKTMEINQGTITNKSEKAFYDGLAKNKMGKMNANSLTVLSENKDDVVKIIVDVANEVDASPTAWEDNGVDYSKTIPQVIEKAVQEGKCTINGMQDAVDCVSENYYTENKDGERTYFDGGYGIKTEFDSSKKTHAENLLAYIGKGYPFMLNYANETEKADLEQRMKNLDMEHQAERLQDAECRFIYDEDESQKESGFYTTDCITTRKYLPGFKPEWKTDDSEYLDPDKVPIASKKGNDNEDEGMNTKTKAGLLAAAATILGAAYELLKVAKDEKDIEKANEMIKEANAMIEKAKKISTTTPVTSEKIDPKTLQEVDINDNTLKDGLYINKATGNIFRKKSYLVNDNNVNSMPEDVREIYYLKTRPPKIDPVLVEEKEK